MKKIVLLIACLLYAVVTHSQWGLNFQTHTHQIVKAMSAPSDNICWFVTNRDSLYKTEDRGLHWVKLPPSNISFNPYGLFVLNASTAFKSSNGSLFKTTDGGISWGVVFTGTAAEPPVVYMKDDLLTGIFANNGLLYKTTDGGITWSSSAITQPPFPVINTTGKGSLWVDGDTVWVALRNKGVASSTNFGQTWNLPTNTGLSFSGSGSISFANPSLGMAIRQNSPYVFVTTDGAATWSMSTNSLGANEAVLAFQSELWFIPNSADHFYIKHSTDSGATWTQQLTDPAGFDTLEKSRNGTTLWAGSDQGSIYVYDASLKTVIPDANVAFSIAPNPFRNQTVLRFPKEQKQATITLIDLLGNVVQKENCSGHEVILDGRNLTPGIYFIVVIDQYGASSLKKIIVL